MWSSFYFFIKCMTEYSTKLIIYMTYFVCVGEDDGPLQVPPLKVDEGAANSGSVPEPIASPWGDVGSTTNTRIRSRRASILEFVAKMEAFDEKELKDPVDWWCASTCRCNLVIRCCYYYAGSLQPS